MYLVDTDWLIQVFNNRTAFVQELDRLAPQGIATSIITIAELFDGVHQAKDPTAVEASIVSLQQTTPVLGIDGEVARQFGALRSQLRQIGMLIPDMDLLIAATALRHNLTLCTQNVKHFSRIPGLSLFSLD
jgi:tRNA(fMet)-specific endonuclease VapC